MASMSLLVQREYGLNAIHKSVIFSKYKLFEIRTMLVIFSQSLVVPSTSQDTQQVLGKNLLTWNIFWKTLKFNVYYVLQGSDISADNHVIITAFWNQWRRQSCDTSLLILLRASYEVFGVEKQPLTISRRRQGTRKCQESTGAAMPSLEPWVYYRTFYLIRIGAE